MDSILIENVTYYYKKDKDRKIKLERPLNGVVMKTPDCKRGVAYVFEKENGEFNIEEFQYFLYNIADYLSSEILGHPFSKHDKERIEIKIVHGSNYDCKDKECRICKEELY